MGGNRDEALSNLENFHNQINVTPKNPLNA